MRKFVFTAVLETDSPPSDKSKQPDVEAAIIRPIVKIIETEDDESSIREAFKKALTDTLFKNAGRVTSHHFMPL